MWLITKEGFISVVADREDSGALLLRARARQDLENILEIAKDADLSGFGEIWEDPLADYRFRLKASRKDFSKVAAALAELIDYDNFKARVARDNPRRASLYQTVWADLLEIENIS